MRVLRGGDCKVIAGQVTARSCRLNRFVRAARIPAAGSAGEMRGTPKMSVFDDFASAYTRFRLAAEYNGHLWHCLVQRAQGGGNLSTKHRHALLRELRSRLLTSENSQRTIAQLFDELLSQAHAFLPSKSGGQTFRVVQCPWVRARSGCSSGAAEPCSGPSAEYLEGDCRRGFRVGIDAHRDIVGLLDVVGIARKLARYYRWPAHARPEKDGSDLDGIAWEATGDEGFIESFLSPTTLLALDLALLALISVHSDVSQVGREDISRIIRNPMLGGSGTKITLHGRISSIIIAVWDRRHRKEKKYKQGPTDPDQLASDSETVDQILRRLDAWDRVERLFSESGTDQQQVLRYVVKRLFEDGADLQAVYEEVIKKFGLSMPQVRAMWSKFKRRLRSEGRP